MTTCGDHSGWALWLTGLPASGKSTLAAELAGRLQQRGQAVEVLESDALRRTLTPRPRYTEDERDLFYAAIAQMAARLARHGVGVIIDATAHRLAYRQAGRRQIERFMEVRVACPLALCRERDAKGIYAAADAGQADHVPGVGVAYEVDEAAEVVVRSDRDPPEDAAARIIAELERRGWLSGGDAAAGPGAGGTAQPAGRGVR